MNTIMTMITFLAKVNKVNLEEETTLLRVVNNMGDIAHIWLVPESHNFTVFVDVLRNGADEFVSVNSKEALRDFLLADFESCEFVQ